MMRNIKRVALMAMLVGSIAVFLSSCAFKLNTEQQTLYNAKIDSIAALAALNDIPKETVESELKAFNTLFKAKGFIVEDKKAGTPIAKGTKADDLRKRFVPKKA